MISVKEMYAIDMEAQEKGISIIQLMENAGSNSARILNEVFPLRNKKVLVFCGTGNNGGDGACFARHASTYGAEVSVFLVKNISEIKGKESKRNYEILRSYGFKIYEEEIPKDLIDKADVIVDALLGIGLKGKVKEPYKSAIERINKSQAFKVSIDCPSGLDADTGEILGAAVRPDLTITLHDRKKGLSEKTCGQIRIASLGIPQ